MNLSLILIPSSLIPRRLREGYFIEPFVDQSLNFLHTRLADRNQPMIRQPQFKISTLMY